MKHIKNITEFVTEVIKVPIKVGDTVLGGRFKNKKIVVKKIGKNDKGDITINGRPLLKFRIIKEDRRDPLVTLSEDINIYLAHLKDDGFEVDLAGISEYYIRVWKSLDKTTRYTYNNCDIFNFDSISDELNRFMSIISKDWGITYTYVIDSTNDRTEIDMIDGDYDELPKEIKSFVVGLKKKL